MGSEYFFPLSIMIIFRMNDVIGIELEQCRLTLYVCVAVWMSVTLAILLDFFSPKKRNTIPFFLDFLSLVVNSRKKNYLLTFTVLLVCSLSVRWHQTRHYFWRRWWYWWWRQRQQRWIREFFSLTVADYNLLRKR